MARNAAIMAAVISSLRGYSNHKTLGTMVVVEGMMLLVSASLPGVPSGTARFVLPGPAASKGMRAIIFIYI